MPTDKRRPLNRTGKALLTGAASFFNYGGNLFVGLVVTPVIVVALGLEQYGIWVMLGQLFGYISLVDVCPTRVLKLTLATEQHSPDDGMKRRQVGAALIIAIGALPLFAISGFLAARFFPQIFKVSPTLQGMVTGAIAIMTIDAALRNITSIPASVLRAMNLDYAAMGVNTFVTIFFGLLNIVVVLAGWGIVGLALNAFVAGLVSSGIRLYIAMKRIPWFGIERPSAAEARLLLKRSAYFTSDSITMTLGQNSETLIIGGILGAPATALYSLTRTLARMFFEITGQIFSSVNPGLADVAGRKDNELLSQLRAHIIKTAIVAAISISVLVYFWNASFVSRWVGADKFAGNAVTALLVAFFSLKLLVSVNRGFMGSLLLIKQENVSASIKNLAVFFLMWAGTYLFGIAGAVSAMTAGEAVFLFYLSWVLKKRMPEAPFKKNRVCAALALAGMAMIFLAPRVQAASWQTLIMFGFITIIATLTAITVIILTVEDRRFWLRRYKGLSGTI
ncbi:MAG: hypothetical protein A2219_00010 [Elusimicrobia bacterium RIFOXYA2_FULL_50_26]|nr:MAG: hypothetical protein A2219_00010 [Elusimicrobia bacterium RIFOXYA2_FULL_50_26]OGS25333.1 MAG: hypothetical protein A2314_06345 [Elusimicrobia bacterium RIFOXYB2_FULL_50_12]